MLARPSSTLGRKPVGAMTGGRIDLQGRPVSTFGLETSVRSLAGTLIAILCAASLGCQSMIARNLGITNTSAATGGLATAAATGDRSKCPPNEGMAAMERPPAELSKVALSTYRIEPPDILLLSLVRQTPKDPYFIKTLDIIRIIVAGTPPDQPIAGDYQVQPGGYVNLGPAYGNAHLKGLTILEAKDAIARQLAGILEVPEVSVSLVQSSGLQEINGEKLVGPDGTVNLGIYGSVYVSGMTVQEARKALEAKLSEYLASPKLSCDVFAYNSKSYYVVLEGAGLGDSIIQRPIQGNETVMDAIAQLQGIPEFASRRMWVSRPAPLGSGCDQILPVDWFAISRGANTSTNYQLLPGDRVYIAEDTFIALGSAVNRLLNPFERILGASLLGTQTIQTLQRFPGGNFLF